ncbi:DNA-3-methyladenine glycosylase family protein [Glacieibacterium frigidum]|uniref:DNA-3-methyladenine glycosylase II n=1 Tax=Glacieibacterium frigidum TaxID=2593303 RepID=A0A552U8I5_9SPHN|nr:DNA-3-methyladenine glycosylase [Glacieibacterium frigidum]TRW14524.1 DNA-3-methyladenine glycosylase 2 family protein [Glacieibacterium frigidum]
MGLSAEALRHGIDSVAAIEPRVAEALARAGYPEPRISDRGATTLMRAIVGQQISVAAAASVWAKFVALVGDPTDMAHIAALPIETLRTAGLSGQKASYVQSLAGHVASGALDIDNLPVDDDEAVAALVAVKGIGRWSAEIYLLFAEGRLDIWPAGDLAVQIELGRIMGLEKRPTEKATRELVEPWRPHRGAMAIFMWHHYKTPVF